MRGGALRRLAPVTPGRLTRTLPRSGRNGTLRTRPRAPCTYRQLHRETAMAETVTIPSPVADEPISLFDLFREFDIVEITDQKGRKMTVAMQALNQEDNALLQEF